MPVVTILAAIWTIPKPTVLFLFYCLQKVLANLSTVYEEVNKHRCFYSTGKQLAKKYVA